MKKTIQYRAILFLAAALFALGGCGAIRQQVHMALDQVAGVTNGSARTEDEYDPYYYDPEWNDPEDAAFAGEYGHLRGRLEGIIYFNDFADVLFAPPEGWTSILSEDDVFSQEGIDLISTGPSDTASSVTIIIEEANPLISEEEYWNARLSMLQEQGFAGQDFGNALLGLYDYRVATITTPEGMLRRYYLRGLDSRTISIIMEAQNISQLDYLIICFA